MSDGGIGLLQPQLFAQCLGRYWEPIVSALAKGVLLRHRAIWSTRSPRTEDTGIWKGSGHGKQNLMECIVVYNHQIRCPTITDGES